MLARWNGLWKARVRMFPAAKHIEQAPECLRCTPRSIHTIGVSHILHPRESVSSFRAALLVACGNEASPHSSICVNAVGCRGPRLQEVVAVLVCSRHKRALAKHSKTQHHHNASARKCRSSTERLICSFEKLDWSRLASRSHHG